MDIQIKQSIWKDRFLVTGDSGSGKTSLVKALNSGTDQIATDLDMVGYRELTDVDKEHWFLPTQLISYWLRQPKTHYKYYCGVSTNIWDIAKLGWDAIFILVPDNTRMRSNLGSRDRSNDKRRLRELTVRETGLPKHPLHSADPFWYAHCARIMGSHTRTIVIRYSSSTPEMIASALEMESEMVSVKQAEGAGDPKWFRGTDTWNLP